MKVQPPAGPVAILVVFQAPDGNIGVECPSGLAPEMVTMILGKALLSLSGYYASNRPKVQAAPAGALLSLPKNGAEPKGV